MRILITGGTGYVGSHCAVGLLNQNHDVVVLDNLSNSYKEVVQKIETITKDSITFFQGDVNNTSLLNTIFTTSHIDAVIHCAGLKAVSESIQEPEKYHQNNVEGAKNLINAMHENKVFNLVFSSSATVYGDPQYLPIDEEHPINPLHPYGSNKILIEKLLKEQTLRNSEWKVLSLRYFNPIGSHHSSLIGDSPSGHPNNLLPYIMQVASNLRPELQIFGNDYPTLDGTGLRDYIHIIDLAAGHIAALNYLFRMDGHSNFDALNLGTGTSHSVLQVVKTFEEIADRKIPYVFSDRREGDITESYADVSKAKLLLNWHAELSLEDMCLSAWKFQKNLMLNA
jgi:UDP-glucose 4-epimerase|tara:strand:- start:4372 stop:5388 length:1017 start_codon:yes stop_codon:yes gene_type:complete